MARTNLYRRVPRHHLAFHRPPQRRDRAEPPPPRGSDLVLAILAVALLGGLALAAAVATVAP